MWDVLEITPFVLFDGMQTMLRKRNSIGIIKKNSTFSFVKIIVLFLILSFTLIFYNYGGCVVAEGSSYIPAPPLGPESGFVNIEYEYSVFTSDLDALWMFDWGDGNYSAWVGLADSEGSVVQSYSWTLTGIYQIRVKYKSSYVEQWSPYMEVNITKPNETDYPNKPTITSGEIAGTANTSYSYSTYATDSKGDKIQYRFDWDDGTISEWTSLVPSGTSSTMSHAWIQAGTYSIKSQARDAIGLNSSWSDPLNVSIDIDSDGDGLSDTIEKMLGSDPKNSSDAYGIDIDDVTHHIVSAAGGEVIIFYNVISEDFSLLGFNDDGTYLLDADCDGEWDYIYNPLFDSVVQYEEPSDEEASFDFPLFWIIIGSVIVVIILITFLLFKKGYIYVYEEEVIDE